MADFFSHDLFGERMLAHLPAAAQSAAALHSAAYHWGLHGPDPLFFHKVALGSPLHKLGNRMHSERTGELFAAFAIPESAHIFTLEALDTEALEMYDLLIANVMAG